MRLESAEIFWKCRRFDGGRGTGGVYTPLVRLVSAMNARFWKAELKAPLKMASSDPKFGACLTWTYMYMMLKKMGMGEKTKEGSKPRWVYLYTMLMLRF